MLAGLELAGKIVPMIVYDSLRTSGPPLGRGARQPHLFRQQFSSRPTRTLLPTTNLNMNAALFGRPCHLWSLGGFRLSSAVRGRMQLQGPRRSLSDQYLTAGQIGAQSERQIVDGEGFLF